MTLREINEKANEIRDRQAEKFGCDPREFPRALLLRMAVWEIKNSYQAPKKLENGEYQMDSNPMPENFLLRDPAIIQIDRGVEVEIAEGNIYVTLPEESPRHCTLAGKALKFSAPFTYHGKEVTQIFPCNVVRSRITATPAQWLREDKRNADMATKLKIIRA